MSSDPELKTAVVDLTLRYNRLRTALRKIYNTVTARGPINLVARLTDVEHISGTALGRRK